MKLGDAFQRLRTVCSHQIKENLLIGMKITIHKHQKLGARLPALLRGPRDLLEDTAAALGRSYAFCSNEFARVSNIFPATRDW